MGLGLIVICISTINNFDIFICNCALFISFVLKIYRNLYKPLDIIHICISNRDGRSRYPDNIQYRLSF